LEQDDADLNELEKTLLNEVTGGVEPLLCLRTGTSVDAGLWVKKVPLWLCITEDRLILFAVGRRRYMQSADLAECMASSYCHATGEFVIGPVEGLEFGRVKISPAEALKVSALLFGGAGCVSR
jgi:hypothetical protein